MDNLMLNHALPELTVEQAKAANRIVRLQNLVFNLGGQYCMRFEDAMDSAYAVDLSLNGKRGTLAICANSMNAILGTFNTSLADVSDEWLLFALRAFAKTQFGSNAQIHGVAPNQVQVNPGNVIAFYAYAAEESITPGYQIGIGAESEFSMDAVFDSIRKFVLGARPAPLENVPITLPLIATALPVEAGILRDMAVGDVIILGG